jgi:hypothetical protein
MKKKYYSDLQRLRSLKDEGIDTSDIPELDASFFENAVVPLENGREMKKKVVLDFTQTEADVDWLRAARLKKAADKGDKEAAAELRRMEETKMTKYASKMNVSNPNEGKK